MGKQEALKRFTTDLTEQARSGKMDPIVGRDDEIRQVVDILMRRRQNNPILVGEAGVGKTAVVEGFAQRIAAATCRRQPEGRELRTLDVGLLQAGASMKGEFEQRLRSVIDEVQASPKPIILFIDETHTLVGAGGAAGTGDAANLLKPALARGTAAHHRRDHLRRVQEAHREGPGADPPLPDRAGRRARRDAKAIADDARRGQHDGEAPQGADPRRGAGGRGQAVAPLHPGAPAARQVGEPARHRLRARGRQPACHAGRGRRQCARIEALETEQEIIGREKAIGIDVAAARGESQTSSWLATEPCGWPHSSARWEQKRRWSIELLALRAKLRDGRGKPVEGTGSALETAAADAQRSRRRSQPPHPDSDRATACWPSSRRCRPSSPRCRAKPR
jgi:type VI secretion system protein VasG